MRNIINDDEVYPRATETRGGRRGRGGRGRGDFNRDGPGPRGPDRDYNGLVSGRPEGSYRGRGGLREERGSRGYNEPPRSNDDFHVRPFRGQRGGDRRRGGMMPPDRYGPGDGYHQRGQFYDRDPYAQPPYDEFHDPYDSSYRP